MVAQSTHVSPLQQHSKSSSVPPSSSKSHNRIQLEVQREGFEVHKENLVKLPLKKTRVPFGMHVEVIAPAPTHEEPLLASRKTGLQSSSMEMHAISQHGHISQPREPETACLKLTPSSEKGSFLAAGNSEHLFNGAASSFTVFCSEDLGEEASQAHQPYPETFPQACTQMSACMTTPLHPRQENILHECVKVGHIEAWKSLSNVGSVKTDAGDEAGIVKGLRYSSSGSGSTHMLSFGFQNFEWGFASCAVIDGSRLRPYQDASNNVCLNANVGMLDWETENRCGFEASCGTSIIREPLEAPLANGLKPLTDPVHAKLPNALSTFSEGEPSLSHALEHLQQQASMKMQRTPACEVSCADSDWGKFLALSATPVTPVIKDAVRDNVKVLPFQQRFKQLQAFLKQCDETDQNECMHALGLLSAAARSDRAVELETRAIKLSLEEGKEMRRMRLLNVLGKISEQNLADAGATPQGSRLPAPGVGAKLKNVTQ